LISLPRHVVSRGHPEFLLVLSPGFLACTGNDKYIGDSQSFASLKREEFPPSISGKLIE
jgi:hypothetical protein